METLVRGAGQGVCFPRPGYYSIQKSQGESHGQNLAISLRFGQKFLLQPVVEGVTDAPDGEDILGRVGVRLDFFAQLADKRHDVAVVQQMVVSRVFRKLVCRLREK